uniref:Uncharacterized protein n=1 Tax=Rhipicephalus zambeziensis TaxID=60191 RepID=A0A224YAS1_9ACAR
MAPARTCSIKAHWHAHTQNTLKNRACHYMQAQSSMDGWGSEAQVLWNCSFKICFNEKIKRNHFAFHLNVLAVRQAQEMKANQIFSCHKETTLD